MKPTVNFNDFEDAFAKCGRQGQFSYAAKRMLFDYMEEINPDYELDVIGLCCDYSEDTIETIAGEYDIAVEDVVDYLTDNTQVVGQHGDIIIYQQF